MLLCMYPFRFSVKLLHYILKNISDYSSRRTPAAKSTASAASITFLLKFFQFPSCFRCQICRNFNLYSCIFITVYRRIIHCNDTFASQTYLRSGLSTRFNVTENVTVNSVNLRLTAKYCCCKWDIYSCVNISAFPFISGFILNVYFQKQVTGFTSADSRISFSFKSDRFTGFNTCRNIDFVILDATVATLQADNLLTAKSSFIKADSNLRMKILTFTAVRTTKAMTAEITSTCTKATAEATSSIASESTKTTSMKSTATEAAASKNTG